MTRREDNVRQATEYEVVQGGEDVRQRNALWAAAKRREPDRGDIARNDIDPAVLTWEEDREALGVPAYLDVVGRLQRRTERGSISTAVRAMYLDMLRRLGIDDLPFNCALAVQVDPREFDEVRFSDREGNWPRSMGREFSVEARGVECYAAYIDLWLVYAYEQFRQVGAREQSLVVHAFQDLARLERVAGKSQSQGHKRDVPTAQHTRGAVPRCRP